MRNKSTVFAAIQRGGEMRAEVTKDGSAKSHKNFLWKNVSTKNTRLMTDGALHLDRVALPYKREFVVHRRKEYVRGDVHVNNVENFWSHVKRSMGGTYKTVLRSICSRILMVLSFTPTTEAATRHASSRCLILYCSIQESHKLLSCIHSLSLPRRALNCGIYSKNIMPCGDTSSYLTHRYGVTRVTIKGNHGW